METWIGQTWSLGCGVAFAPSFHSSLQIMGWTPPPSWKQGFGPKKLRKQHLVLFGHKATVVITLRNHSRKSHGALSLIRRHEAPLQSVHAVFGHKSAMVLPSRITLASSNSVVWGINGRFRYTKSPRHRQFQPLVQRCLDKGGGVT